MNMIVLSGIREYINKQIKTRKELLNSMVGNLYPPMIQEEIDKLEKALECLKK